MRPKKAFALIELLIVIAITALLLAIVTPSLRKAKDYAKRTICMNNSRQIAIGLRVYAENNDNEIIPMRLPDAQGTITDNPFAWQGVLTLCEAYRDGNGKMVPMHLGVLYDLGLIENPKVFYCPSQPRNSDYPIPYYYDFYTKDGTIEWNSDVVQIPNLSGHRFVRTSYNYWTYGKKRLGQLSGNKPIMVDNLQEWEVIPHRKGSRTTGDPQGVTAVFVDGHVSFCTDRSIFDKDLWPRFPTYFDGPGNNKAVFQEVLRRIQNN